MGLSLVAFDTDHIKAYVFGTDRLKEIRGASSLLDRLNRQEMEEVARKRGIQVTTIYANGGAGLFVVDTNKAQEFQLLVQQMYRERSKGRASITGVVWDLLGDDIPDTIEALMTHDLKRQLSLMRYRLRAEKDRPPDIIALPSHPFMRPCDSCGIDYAEQEQHDAGEADTFYCASCLKKQEEDRIIKNHIADTVERIRNGKRVNQAYTWGRIVRNLFALDYFSGDVVELDHPIDFNEFSQFTAAKEYLGLIYADANNMGAAIDKLATLQELRDFAELVDGAIHRAMSHAIKSYLPPVTVRRDDTIVPIFPFDILLIGGDDIVMVTDAAKAMHVALAMAQEFRRLTENKYSLAVGVVLAPIKYPFGLLHEMAESTMKFAKTAGAGAATDSDPTRINFLTVTGGSEPDFKDIYQEHYHTIADKKSEKSEFYATLRPYTPEELQLLLNVLATGGEMNLGRTKLYQLREAVLAKNLTTSVKDGLAALLNWRDRQRSYVVDHVYQFGQRYQMPHSDPGDALLGFPRVTFPWFADGTSKEGRAVYRTPLLDFIELYDFVSREGDDRNAQG